ncbi:winged helix-turn-helix transcriptional regulator [Dyadobacter fanqingshengii]|uniref:Helix-turn-helix transcriptional regulator n=1 Tax=Dyadobacter fanqingshengii TaxID=2906443 RepID=A0A9X1PFQ0_9BACT|nr:helix-turn-helix domain-containing protein [Dyadobacter fanqingshengii]MCF0042848.1 helix-turn-helix transcriptional regulator [Dyadobacter fanqingshengii]MCF0043470.1 helix-turn-helix transcriptional regulator [Dyadobacter fanqingshengii]USJ35934.1 helix-turn-helix transcriptional regulator [Dyadobacter fanqingshengii]
METAEIEIAAKKATHTYGECTKSILPVRDALEVLSGKWKLPIIISLIFGNKRFSQIAKEIPGITDKMLSKELRDLEANCLVKRTVYDSIPVVVEYTLTDYGHTLKPVIEVLRNWGEAHRNRIMSL